MPKSIRATRCAFRRDIAGHNSYIALLLAAVAGNRRDITIVSPHIQRAGAPGRRRRQAGHGRPAQRSDRAAFLFDGETPEASAALRAAETTGRPFGNTAFIEGLERIQGRRLARGRPGPAPQRTADVA